MERDRPTLGTLHPFTPKESEGGAEHPQGRLGQIPREAPKEPNQTCPLSFPKFMGWRYCCCLLSRVVGGKGWEGKGPQGRLNCFPGGGVRAPFHPFPFGARGQLIFPHLSRLGMGQNRASLNSKGTLEPKPRILSLTFPS